MLANNSKIYNSVQISNKFVYFNIYTSSLYSVNAQVPFKSGNCKCENTCHELSILKLAKKGTHQAIILIFFLFQCYFEL